MRIFMVTPPTEPSRVIKHEAMSFEEAKKKLLIGYKIVGELVDNVPVPVLPDGLKRYTYLTHILIHHGDELKEWLQDQGFRCLDLSL